MTRVVKYICYENEEDYINITYNDIFNRNFTIENIYLAFQASKIEILIYLVKLKLIKNRMFCNDCGLNMNLIKNKSIDGYGWICRIMKTAFKNQYAKIAFS